MSRLGGRRRGRPREGLSGDTSGKEEIEWKRKEERRKEKEKEQRLMGKKEKEKKKDRGGRKEREKEEKERAARFSFLVFSITLIFRWVARMISRKIAESQIQHKGAMPWCLLMALNCQGEPLPRGQRWSPHSQN